MKPRILVVDDDEALLKSVCGTLEDVYNVLSANTGADALQQSKDSRSEIHVLLSDFQMPGMTGIELATQITVQRPKIKVLLMSGYNEGMLVLNEGWQFLAKPFIQSQLRTLITGLVAPDLKSRYKASA